VCVCMCRVRVLLRSYLCVVERHDSLRYVGRDSYVTTQRYVQSPRAAAVIPV